MHHYFRQSDQVPTALFVCTNFTQTSTNSDNHYLAGALLLQRTPIDHSKDIDLIQKEEDDWFTDISLLATITPDELLSRDLSSEKLLHRLFHERFLTISEKKAIQANCHCSRKRLEDILINFSKTDLDDVLVDGKIEVICEFCNENYIFLEQEIQCLQQLKTDKD
jgi:molecular chaperone Hsp33